MYISAIEAEKKENEFRSSIEGFPKGQLKPTETAEKNVLPTKEGMVGP